MLCLKKIKFIELNYFVGKIGYVLILDCEKIVIFLYLV